MPDPDAQQPPIVQKTATEGKALTEIQDDGPSSNDPQTGMASPMPAWAQAALGAYIFVLLVFLVLVLARLWPVNPGQRFETTEFPWGVFTFPLEVRYMLIAACAGALGAYIHLATSFADFAGNRKLAASWAWWYVLRPCIGAALAEVIYLTFRGGFVGTGNASDVNPSGVAAICALSGLFSKQATDKLREVFETMFRTHQQVERADALPKTPPAVPAEPEPEMAAGAAAGKR